MIILILGACSTSRPSQTEDTPAIEMTVIGPEMYTDASALAAAGSSPIDIAVAVVGPFEGRTQTIIQENASSEAPSAAQLSVRRDGLLDDAILGDLWEIDLERSLGGPWQIDEVRRAWRCARGSDPDDFTTTLCP
jgi:hypothetical protein